MAIYLGVDGGGTKTAYVLLTSDGQELGSFEGPSSYHLEHGIPQVRRVLIDGVATVMARAGVTAGQLDFAFFAIPGYGEISRETALLDSLPVAALGHDRYRCGNDMIAGWAGSLAVSDGINVVCGTGSMTYGERASRGVRVGGWGELLGDEGSGHWIGLKALNAFTRMSDGRLPRTLLYERIRAFADIDADLELIDVVQVQWERSRSRIASLAPAVIAAAADGDDVADSILRRAAHHLADLADTTWSELGFTDGEPVPISYSGGVFKAEAVRSRFAALLAERLPAYELRPPRFPSDVGAALYAAKLHGAPLGPAALSQLAAGRDAPGKEPMR